MCCVLLKADATQKKRLSLDKSIVFVKRYKAIWCIEY